MNRQIEALIGEDWACLDDEVSEEYLLDTYYNTDIWPDADEQPKEWLKETIDQNPGVWTAEICRMKHNRPSDNENIAWCGLCSEYANGRKRQRSANLPEVLPGFEEIGGAYKLHPPCSNRALTWLRKTTDRWAKVGKIIKEKLQVIPDPRQARGWDFGTRIYPRKG